MVSTRPILQKINSAGNGVNLPFQPRFKSTLKGRREKANEFLRILDQSLIATSSLGSDSLREIIQKETNDAITNSQIKRKAERSLVRWCLGIRDVLIARMVHSLNVNTIPTARHALSKMSSTPKTKPVKPPQINQPSPPWHLSALDQAEVEFGRKAMARHAAVNAQAVQQASSSPGIELQRTTAEPEITVVKDTQLDIELVILLGKLNSGQAIQLDPSRGYPPTFVALINMILDDKKIDVAELAKFGLEIDSTETTFGHLESMTNESLICVRGKTFEKGDGLVTIEPRARVQTPSYPEEDRSVTGGYILSAKGEVTYGDIIPGRHYVVYRGKINVIDEPAQLTKITRAGNELRYEFPSEHLTLSDGTGDLGLTFIEVAPVGKTIIFNDRPNDDGVSDGENRLNFRSLIPGQLYSVDQAGKHFEGVFDLDRSYLVEDGYITLNFTADSVCNSDGEVRIRCTEGRKGVTSISNPPVDKIPDRVIISKDLEISQADASRLKGYYCRFQQSCELGVIDVEANFISKGDSSKEIKFQFLGDNVLCPLSSKNEEITITPLGKATIRDEEGFLDDKFSRGVGIIVDSSNATQVFGDLREGHTYRFKISDGPSTYIYTGQLNHQRSHGIPYIKTPDRVMALVVDGNITVNIRRIKTAQI